MDIIVNDIYDIIQTVQYLFCMEFQYRTTKSKIFSIMDSAFFEIYLHLQCFPGLLRHHQAGNIKYLPA